MRVESSYLGWFVEKIDGCEELKEAIKAHPRFPAVRESYQQCRQKIQQKAEWQQGQFSEPSIDIICDELFHEPEAEGMTRLKIIKTVHYGKYVQSGENLYCDKTGRRPVPVSCVRGWARVRAMDRHARDRPVGGAAGNPGGDGHADVLLRRMRRRVEGRQVLQDAEAHPAKRSTNCGICPPDAPGCVRMRDHDRGRRSSRPSGAGSTKGVASCNGVGIAV